MLNDRRMAVRMQSQTRDGEISELNYKISVMLKSEQGSEVEGLRFVLTRRIAMAIVFIAVVFLGNLSYESEERRRREARSSQSADAGTSGGAAEASFTVPSREVGTQTTGAEEKGVIGDKSENVGFVSLG